MKRGQAAFEYMVLVGALLAILIPLFNYVSSYSNENIKIEKAEDSVRTLGRTADSLYALGPGNKDFVWINLPGSIASTDVSNNQILIQLATENGNSDFYFTTVAEVNGTIPNEKGTFKMVLNVLDSGVVQIDPGYAT